MTAQAVRDRPAGQIFAVGLGMGVDSVAVLVRLHKIGLRPDIITFANTGCSKGTGGEKPETYQYIPVINRWLRKVGFPEVIVVHKTGKHDSLFQNCVQNETLPSLAFGRKGCSQKWKKQPQEKFMNNWGPAKAAWAAGHKVIKAIGYDCGAADSRRSNIKDDAKYTYWYPLREWGMTRVDCIAEIESVGLPVPVKSACFYCPATKKPELVQLATYYPELIREALVMEDTFLNGRHYRPPMPVIKVNKRTKMPVLDATGEPVLAWKVGTEGLGRNWSWRQFLESQGLLTQSLGYYSSPTLDRQQSYHL